MFRLIAAVSTTVWAAIQWWMVLVWMQMDRQYGVAFLHAHHIEPKWFGGSGSAVTVSALAAAMWIYAIYDLEE